MILVSRPAPQLSRTTAALRRAGYTDLLPLPVAEYHNYTLENFPADATALLLTSAAALTALMAALRRTGPVSGRPGCLRFLPAWCVGAATARAAKKAGLNVVYAGKGNGADLARQLLQTFKTPQTFLHLHADNAQAPWAKPLTEAGHKLAALTAYHTAYLHTLPSPVVEALRQKQPTHTLLFSPAGALRLRGLLQQSNITPSGIAVALSPAVAQAAQGFWPSVQVSAKPTLAGMLKTLGNNKAAT